MPVLFNPDLLQFATAQIKSVTTALGGAARVVISEDNPKGERLIMPFHLARNYMKEQKGGDYLAPRHSEILLYDKHPIGFEGFPYKAYMSATRDELDLAIDMWTSRIRRILQKHIIDYIKKDDIHNWCIDGYVLYGLIDESLWLKGSEPLNKDGTFRRMRVPVINFADLSKGVETTQSAENFISERDCLVFNAPDGKVYITPPIWTNLGQVGSRKLSGIEEKEVDDSLFDYIDQQLHVNINFALDTAMTITTLFGHEKAEPLQLPELMMEYQTLNLIRLPKEVKQTAPCGIQFTHVMAWLMGLFKDPDNLKAMLDYRSILKQLTTKGLQNGDVMDDSMIYNDGFDSSSISLYSFKHIEHYRTIVEEDLIQHVA